MLIKEYPLLIYPKLATRIGLNEAIVLQQIHFWIEKSGKTRQGRKWIYNTHDEWQQQFPFWSIKTIQRTIKSLVDQGLISKGNYNKMKIDKTLWYSINYEKIPSEPVNKPLGQIVHMDTDKMTTPITIDNHKESEIDYNELINYRIIGSGKNQFAVRLSDEEMKMYV
jgi:Fe2+ or Zn2+ uptake regulation protein